MSEQHKYIASCSYPSNRAGSEEHFSLIINICHNLLLFKYNIIYHSLIILSSFTTGHTFPMELIIVKNEPPTGLTVDSYLLPTSKSRDTKTRTQIKNLAQKALGIVP